MVCEWMIGLIIPESGGERESCYMCAVRLVNSRREVRRRQVRGVGEDGDEDESRRQSVATTSADGVACSLSVCHGMENGKKRIEHGRASTLASGIPTGAHSLLAGQRWQTVHT